MFGKSPIKGNYQSADGFSVYSIINPNIIVLKQFLIC